MKRGKIHCPPCTLVLNGGVRVKASQGSFGQRLFVAGSISPFK